MSTDLLDEADVATSFQQQGSAVEMHQNVAAGAANSARSRAAFQSRLAFGKVRDWSRTTSSVLQIWSPANPAWSVNIRQASNLGRKPRKDRKGRSGGTFQVRMTSVLSTLALR